MNVANAMEMGLHAQAVMVSRIVGKSSTPAVYAAERTLALTAPVSQTVTREWMDVVSVVVMIQPAARLIRILLASSQLSQWTVLMGIRHTSSA
jgi:hypothetical protein